MRGLIIAAGLTAALATPAASEQRPLPEQALLIAHIAEATMLSRRCGRIAVDAAYLADLMGRRGMPQNSFSPGGPFETAMISAMDKAAAEAAGQATEQACINAVLSYGPGGTDRPGLVR